ncbi:MAG: rod shape-determining protein RodA [Chitinophagales bacterium]|nr:rod shape-determining protein RodA [Bacteroidota bacterium]MCB9043663.1 rod shape-determining protein RodA [Chitinophagales bacterium]
MNRTRNIAQSRDTDWTLVLLYFIFVGIGLMSIFSANYDANVFAHIQFSDLWQTHFGKQIIWIGIAVVVAFVIQLLDSRFFTLSAFALYGTMIAILVLVFFLGKEIAGSRSWFQLGGFRFQPSELAKSATVLALAKYLSSLHVNIRQFTPKLITAGIILLPMLLTTLQGDAGTALVYSSLVLVLYREGLAGIFLIVTGVLLLLLLLTLMYGVLNLGTFLSIAGIIVSFVFFNQNKKDFILLFGGSLALLLGNIFFPPAYAWIWFIVVVLIALGNSFFYFQYKFNAAGMLTLLTVAFLYIQLINYGYENMLKPHQKARIAVMLGKVEDIRGVGYNLHQSKIAIGSGGLWGKGYLHGLQTKGNFVPELHTDFIFCTIGEEFGFWGSLVLLGLFTWFFIKLILVAERQHAAFSRIYAYGTLAIFFFHVVVNIGMTIGLLPIIGIPLPFVSYGGSSLISFTVLLFILIRLDANRRYALR